MGACVHIVKIPKLFFFWLLFLGLNMANHPAWFLCYVSSVKLLNIISSFVVSIHLCAGFHLVLLLGSSFSLHSFAFILIISSNMTKPLKHGLHGFFSKTSAMCYASQILIHVTVRQCRCKTEALHIIFANSTSSSAYNIAGPITVLQILPFILADAISYTTYNLILSLSCPRFFTSFSPC